MKLHGDQVEALKDCFAIFESRDVMPLQKKIIEDNSAETIREIDHYKKINISFSQKYKMITVGFMVETTTKIDVLEFFNINEKSIVSSYINMPGIDPNIVKHQLLVNPLAKSVK